MGRKRKTRCSQELTVRCECDVYITMVTTALWGALGGQAPSDVSTHMRFANAIGDFMAMLRISALCPC
jgi:hypothetical protein